MSIYDVNVSQLGEAIAWKENKLKATLAFFSLMLIGQSKSRIWKTNLSFCQKRTLLILDLDCPNIDKKKLLFRLRRACGHMEVGTCPHQVLAATLTLYQPGGADYAHLILVSTPSFESYRRACEVITTDCICIDAKYR